MSAFLGAALGSAMVLVAFCSVAYRLFRRQAKLEALELEAIRLRTDAVRESTNRMRAYTAMLHEIAQKTEQRSRGGKHEPPVS